MLRAAVMQQALSTSQNPGEPFTALLGVIGQQQFPQQPNPLMRQNNFVVICSWKYIFNINFTLKTNVLRYIYNITLQIEASKLNNLQFAGTQLTINHY